MIKDLADAQIDNYKRQPAELVSHFNREASALDGYRGRQLLELLQNADDAGDRTEAGSSLHIHLSRDRLLVANTGQPFDKSGVRSLVISDCSPKQLDRNRFIGCKGLGFRSILAWTDRPLISSGPYNVVFDQFHAMQVVRALTQEYADIAEIVTQFEKADGRLPAAVMRFPRAPESGECWLREAEDWRGRGFDTVIVIPLRQGDRGDETHRDIKEQLSGMPASALLFCRHLTEVEITGDYRQKWELDRGNRESNPATVTLLKDGEGEEWTVYRRTGRVSPAAAATSAGARSEYEVAVAVPKTAKSNPDGTLCVFFPTHERMPCALVMHATLETTDDRNRLVNHASNCEVLKHLAAHVGAVLEDEAKPDLPRRGLELLAGAERNDPELIKLGFLDTLVADCASRPIFPCLDGTLKPARLVRQVPHGVWLRVATAESFPDVMPVGPDDSLKTLVSVFKLGWLDPATLKARLQCYLLSLPRMRAGEIVGQLLAAKQLSSVGAGGLLIDADGEFISDGDCFLNPVEELPPLPEWAANLRFIDNAFQTGLLTGTKLLTLRNLVAELSRYGAKTEEYRFDTVARALIAEAEGDLAEEDELRVERWRDLLHWLLHGSAGVRQLLPSLSIQVVTVGGVLRRATTCYLGPAYARGSLVNWLYKHFGQDEFVAPPGECGLVGVPLNEAEDFLVSLGVNHAPKITEFQSGPEYHQFVRTVVCRLDFPRSVREHWCNNAQELEKHCVSYKISGLQLPDRWLRLLAEGDSLAIAAYLLSSGNALVTSDTAPQATFQAKVGLERNYHPDTSIPIPNPTLYYLRETEWVKGADGRRHRPSGIMLSGYGVRVLRGIYVNYTIEVGARLIVGHGGRTAVEALLTRLGAVSSVESLSGHSLYDLLLSLPERDPDGKLAPRVYRTLIGSSVSGEDSPQRASFLRAGRMWGRYKGEDRYLPVGELRYNASLTVTKAIEEHIPLVAIPRRMNTVHIKNLFGISPLASEEIRLDIRDDGTTYDAGSEDANQHLRVALPFIYALRLDKNLDDRGRELGLLRKAVLRVCSHAEVTATLPGGRVEEISLEQPGERLVVGSTLLVVGEYRENLHWLTFWLVVAELVAELLGLDVADEVGNVLRCRTPVEMLELVRVRLADNAEAKLSEAKSRFADLLPDPDDSSYHPMPAPPAGAPNTSSGSSTEPGGPSMSEDAGTSETTDGRPTPPPTTPTFTPVQGPGTKQPRKRALVVVGLLAGGGRGRGPMATEPITFKIVEPFEQAEGRFVLQVSHLHGSDGFGCDLLSVRSAEVRDAAIRAQVIDEADVLRYIEVKGRNSRTGEIELSDNQLRAAKRHRDRYWLYRVFVDPHREAHYQLALLNDPLNSAAVRTATRFDLAEGSGAKWFAMGETLGKGEGSGEHSGTTNQAAPELRPDSASGAGQAAPAVSRLAGGD
jgi:hypothetical protein